MAGSTRSPRTWQAYSEHLVDWCDTLEQSNIAWTDVTREHLAAYRDRHLTQRSPRTNRPYALATIRARLGAVTRFYVWAHREELIETLPFAERDVRVSDTETTVLGAMRVWRTARRNELSLRSHEKTRHALAVDEIRRLHAALKVPYGLMCQGAVRTGMRRMEICALTLANMPETYEMRSRATGLSECR